VWACALALAGLLLHESAAAAGEQAVAAADDGEWFTAFEQASLAAAQDPDVHPYALTAGIAAAHLDEPEIAARYLRTVAEGDDLPEAWVDLAAVEATLGDHQAALDAVHAALRLGVQRAPIAMAAGGLLLQLGKPDEARQAFAVAIADRPSIAGDPWWQTPGIAAVVPSIEDLAIPAAAPGVRWEIALMAGDRTGATDYAADPEASPLATSVIAGWSGDPSAAGELFAACRRDPTDLERLRWCARLAAHEGDLVLADQFRAIGEGISPGSSEGAAELRVASPGDTRVGTTQTARYWGLYTYRRPTPADLLVPGLIHLVLA
jgi:tetratricopeptide (TPR) repeat protein